MRPRVFTRGIPVGCMGLQVPIISFNEAARLHARNLTRHSALVEYLRASMRPRVFTRGINRLRTLTFTFTKASMRPRVFTRGILYKRRRVVGDIRSFNEAARLHARN